MNVPNDEQIEAAMLGTAMRNAEGLDALLKLTESDFYRPSHTEAYRAIVHLANGGAPVNLATVSSRLRENRMLEVVGGVEVLREWLAVSNGSQSAFYVDKLRELSARRRMIELSAQMLAAATNEEDPIDASCERMNADFQAIISGDAKPVPTFGEGMRKTLDKITDGAKNGRPPIEISTGLVALDYWTCGLHRQELTVIAGRTSAGKTSLAVQLACYVAVHHGPALLFSLEMPAEDIHKRLYAMEANVDMQAIRQWRLRTDDLAEMEKAYQRLRNAELIIDDTSDVSLRAVRQRAHQIKTPPSLIVVDYLQIMSLAGMNQGSKRAENRTRELDEASRLLKLIARDFNCPVITLSQLNRQASATEDKRPMLEHLRESGGIAANADNVIFVHSASYDASPEATPPSVVDAEIIIAKQRNGPRNVKVAVQWRPKHVRFEEPCDEEREREAVALVNLPQPATTTAQPVEPQGSSWHTFGDGDPFEDEPVARFMQGLEAR